MYRRRIEYEDNLLITRTGIFLVANGLLTTAIGVGATEPFKSLIALLGLTVASIWFTCSCLSWKVINALTIKYLDSSENNEAEVVVQAVLTKSGKYRPTYLLGKILPVLFLIAWLLMLIAHSWLLIKDLL